MLQLENSVQGLPSKGNTAQKLFEKNRYGLPLNQEVVIWFEPSNQTTETDRDFIEACECLDCGDDCEIDFPLSGIETHFKTYGFIMIYLQQL